MRGRVGESRAHNQGQRCQTTFFVSPIAIPKEPGLVCVTQDQTVVDEKNLRGGEVGNRQRRGGEGQCGFGKRAGLRTPSRARGPGGGGKKVTKGPHEEGQSRRLVDKVTGEFVKRGSVSSCRALWEGGGASGGVPDAVPQWTTGQAKYSRNCTAKCQI